MREYFSQGSMPGFPGRPAEGASGLTAGLLGVLLPLATDWPLQHSRGGKERFSRTERGPASRGIYGFSCSGRTTAGGGRTFKNTASAKDRPIEHSLG